MLPAVMDAVRARRFAWLGGGRHLTATTHVDNTVEGLILAADKGKPGEAYFVTDGSPVVFREFLTELLSTQGVDAPGRSVPVAVARLIAEAGERTWKILRRPGFPPLDNFTVWVSGLECTINISKARSELGYEPVRSREEGFAELRGATT